MTIQNQPTIPMLNQLEQVFTFAFIETAVYHFVFPKQAQYVAARISKKICRCLCCNEIIEVAFRNESVVHIEKSRLAEQKKRYAALGLPFPAVAQGEPLVYQQTGYCEKCFAANLQQPEQPAQLVYHLCRQIYELDRQFAAAAGRLMDAAVSSWLEKTPDQQFFSYDLSGYIAVRELLSGVVANDEAVNRHIREYQRRLTELAGQVKAHLTCMAANKFTAIVGKPLDIYETMAVDIYNEYTVAFPEPDMPAGEFFTEASLVKDRIIMFLEQGRIKAPDDLLRELGFADQWIEWLARRMATIEQD